MCNTYEDWYEKEFNKHESLLDEEIVLRNHKLVDENGVDISKKKSSEKTVEERIKTSRSLKIKYNKWNQVDFTEDNYQQDKIAIDKDYSEQRMSSFDDVEFEQKFHEIIKNSKYKAILLDDDCEKVVINYQIINDILLYIYARMKNEYTLSKIFVMVCEYCGINIQTMWKRLSSYIQKTILEELSEYSQLASLELDKEENQLF
jgi:hypothetical protein